MQDQTPCCLLISFPVFFHAFCTARSVQAFPAADAGCSGFILLYLGKVVKQESDSVCSSILHFFGAFVQKGENVVVEIPVQAGEKKFKYEQKVKLVNPKLYGRGYAIGDMGHTDYVLVADDIVAVEEK